MAQTTGTVSFGFDEVAESEKARLVGDIFARVASRYDLMNDLMSGGLHRAWKSALIDWLAPPTNDKRFDLLDVAGGTGDIAFRFLDRAGRNACATLSDINAAMLGEGVARAEGRYPAERLRAVVADAEKLPFPDRSFDAYTIAFGIRNVTHIDQALSDAYRVLKPGGRLLVLEFSEVQVPGLEEIYELYSFEAIPRIGEWVTQNGDAYKYLVESIRRFPPQDVFAGMIEDAAFRRVSYRNFTGGIAALHSGWRL